MPLLLLLFLAMACLPDLDSYERPAWIATPGTATLFTLTLVGLPALFAFVASRWVSAQIRAAQFPHRILNRYDRLRRWQQLSLFIGYALALVLCGWGWAVNAFWRFEGKLLPFPELILLLPIVGTMVFSWACWFDADRAAHQSLHRGSDEPAPLIFSRRDTYVMFHLRARLGLILIPLGLLILQKELHYRFGVGSEQAEWLFQRLGLVSLLVLIPLMPLLVRLVLGLRPMPDGPMRRRLEAVARRLHFRCSDLLVWNTRGGMANAMVLGVLPWPRYVVFTDRMLEEFQPEEVEAVFGHEIGHVKHHHMLYYMGFLAISMLVLGLAVTRLAPLMPDWGWTLFPGSDDPGAGVGLLNRQLVDALPLVACLVVYVFVVFGYLSRRCERQADIYGCRAVSCGDPHCQGHDPEMLPTRAGLCPTGIRTFIRALEKVGYVNGISRDRPGFLQSWQHSTIARRVEFLQSLLREPELEPRFQTRVALVKFGLLLLLATVLFALLGTHT